MKPMVVIAAYLLATILPVAAQTNTNTNSTTARIRHFTAKLPGGTYTVALGSIVSVSSHTYIVEGGMQVTEACIADSGSALARFYFVEPFKISTPSDSSQYTMDKLKQLSGDAAAHLGMDASMTNIVVKNYPFATHAKTIEYRLPTKEAVEQLRKMAEEAFLSGTTKTFEIK